MTSPPTPRRRRWRRGRWGSHLGSDTDRATLRALRTALRTASALRGGLTEQAAQRSVDDLRSLVGSASLVLTDDSRVMAWSGDFDHHREHAEAAARGRPHQTVVLGRRDVECQDLPCPVAAAVVCPLVVEGVVVGTVQVFTVRANAGLLSAVEEVAAWVSGQLELAALDASRTRLMEAEVRALRAQISPHFIYNSLNAIASFVRTDPGKARELLLDFADFTRYSFRRHGEFTTLAEELRSIERYLVLEQARFGDRLRVSLQVDPEVLGVTVPFLCLQPLVENAVRHGLESREGPGLVEIVAVNRDQEAVISVEDDGVGEDPEHVRQVLAGTSDSDSVGLGNVDGRLRSAFGDEYGLVVETALGAGTKVTLRVPKFAAGVHA
ncbi:sensor histidine kinase [Nocardioides marmoribigeumensis]|uniref:Two-component system LytT family sensor kinase n=1 Tax=Nocardioides marmoribigeumensis TaxID=433649 RepID=A0ABU2BW05_9ACTN|nr:histidine kinase [Nocardioides marmoribigeumensis]MDR7362821.1 two-component system LytT family sensor kinase [Nocardioides marmoribigeumensis]